MLKKHGFYRAANVLPRLHISKALGQQGALVEININTLNALQPYITPVVILVLGIWAKNIATKHENRTSLHNRVIEKRVDVYELVGKDLNDIFCFVVRVGNWKQLTPEEIVKKKRAVDQLMYINRPYWSDKSFTSYTSFMTSAFEVYSGSGQDAKIKADFEKYKTIEINQDDWAPYFSDKTSDTKALWRKFRVLMKSLSHEFGFHQ